MYLGATNARRRRRQTTLCLATIHIIPLSIKVRQKLFFYASFFSFFVFFLCISLFTSFYSILIKSSILYQYLVIVWSIHSTKLVTIFFIISEFFHEFDSCFLRFDTQFKRLQIDRMYFYYCLYSLFRQVYIVYLLLIFICLPITIYT